MNKLNQRVKWIILTIGYILLSMHLYMKYHSVLINHVWLYLFVMLGNCYLVRVLLDKIFK